MKTIKKVKLLLIAMTVTFMACSSSDNGSGNNDDTPGGNTSDSMKAKVNGQEWVASFTSAVYQSGQETLIISGGEADEQGSKSIVLTLKYDGIGEYKLIEQEGINPTNIGSYNVTTSTNEQQMWLSPYEYNTECGKITITHRSNGKIKGTFSMNVRNVMTNQLMPITNGEFDLPVTEY